MISRQLTSWAKPAAGLPSKSGRLVLTALSVFITNTYATPPDSRLQETNIRLGSDRSIIATRANPRAMQSRFISRSSLNEHSRPPVAGFSPLVAITTSDERRDSSVEGPFEHDIQYSYVGSNLTGTTTPEFVIGYLDSGSDVDLAAGTSVDTLGLAGLYLTENIATLIGVGDEQLEGLLTQPIGVFAAGLSAIRPNGTLDMNEVVGHTNVSAVAAPPIECGGAEVVNAVVGMPFVSFFNSIIRVDAPRKVINNGRTYTGPDVQILPPFEVSPGPEWPHRITIVFGGLVPVQTASYYPDILNFEDQETPFYPTAMSASSFSVPTGGKFFIPRVWLLEGVPGPTNTEQDFRFMLDTGSQSSIISNDVAGTLSLPFEPDFEVDICGVGGITTGVPGYYLDYVEVPARGGALQFSNVPFIVLDLPNPEGNPPVLPGILGMNFFWNRNVLLDPSLTQSAYFWTSGSIDFAYGDFDRDLDVDADDGATLVSCLAGPDAGVLGPECYHLDSEQDGDLDLADIAAFQRCYSGTDVAADIHCGP